MKQAEPTKDALDLFMAERRAEQEKLDAACEETRAVFRKHFPSGAHNGGAPVALAACAELFPCDDSREMRQLYVEWMMEHFAGRKVLANFEDFNTLYASLVEAGFTEDSPYNHNDGDNNLFYIPHESNKIVCITTQGRRYFYMQGCYRFHVRRYYDEYNFDGPKDKWDLEAEASFKEEGILKAIAKSEDLLWWSDCVPGNLYPQRPSLRFFKDLNFEMAYKDCRDIGYVATYCDLGEPRVDRAIENYPELSLSFFYLRHAIKGAEGGFTEC